MVAMMKVWLNDLQVCSEIMRTEEITEHTYFITDSEYQGIKETQAGNGFIWIENNKVRYSGVKPSEEYRFDETEKKWVVDPELQKALQIKKADAVWERIKELRAYKNTQGFYVKSIDKWLHSDQPAINNYQIVGMNILLQRYQPELWKTMDGSWVTMTREIFEEAMSAMEEHGKFNFRVAEEHYQKLLKSENPEQYDFSTGWKPNYNDTI